MKGRMNMQTSRECVKRAIEFKGPDRMPLCLDFDKDRLNQEITRDILKDYQSDMMIVASHDPEFKPIGEGYNQWGYIMETFGETMGEVKDYPLKSWDDFDNWASCLPDFTSPSRYREAVNMRELHPDKYLVGGLGMMMEEMLNLRGYENSMIDYYEEEENLCKLIDCLYEKGKQMVEGYAAAGMDAVIAWEDWGLQNSPMMALDLWKEYYYDKMKDFVDFIHQKGMKYILHSCGHITYLLDIFIEIGVDVIQMDQQKNMGLELLSKWKGKICFLCPADIQHSVQMSSEQLKMYIEEMIEMLGAAEGGFIYKSYPQPAAIHMTEERLREEIELMKGA